MVVNNNSNNHGTMERAFYDIHYQMCSIAIKYTSVRFRFLMEHLLLILSVSVFCAVILSHRQYIYRGGSSSSHCLQSIPGFQPNVDLIHIQVITSEDSNSDKSWVCHNTTNWQTCFNQQQQEYNTKSKFCEKNENHLNHESTNTHYTYSKIKGLLYLSSEDEAEKKYHGIASTQHIVISSRDSNCFGNDPLLLYLVHSTLGYDTIIMNWLLQLSHMNTKNHLSGRGGYVYIPKSKTVLDLEEYFSKDTFRMSSLIFYHHQRQTTSNSIDARKSDDDWSTQQLWHTDFIIFKLGVLVSSLFLFFLTTTLVSFTLRETQNRMLHFALQLQHHVRQRRPISTLIISHIVENMVFVPIMIGMVFFLMDCFYNGDKLLAFMIISGVWVSETYSAVCLRSLEGTTFFPKAFFLYFTLFHIYCFSCPFGFIYLSLASTCFFLLHCMFFFWNRYELPAVVSGRISRESPRILVFTQQQSRLLYGQSSYPSMNSLGMISNTSIPDPDQEELYYNNYNHNNNNNVALIGGELVMHRGLDSNYDFSSRASSPLVSISRNGSRVFTAASTLSIINSNNTNFSSSSLSNYNNNNTNIHM